MIHAEYNAVLNFNGISNFINNSAVRGDWGGAIYAGINSKLAFNGMINFTNNTCTVGGGVYMPLDSTLSILPNTTVYWQNNHATLGGAIYIEDASPISYCRTVATLITKEECFFQLPGQNLSTGTIDVQLIFKNNFADAAGSVLYGGAIDSCKLTHGLESYSSGKVFDMLVHIDNYSEYNTTSSISSDPLQICPCENNNPDCSDSRYDFPRTVYPGETFQVSVVAVGQRDGTVPSTVRSSILQISYPGYLPDSQRLQQTNNTCTILNYTVFSLSPSVYIKLHAEDSPCLNLGDIYKIISVSLNQTCPPGFNLSESEQSCVCEPRLAQYTGEHKCIIQME